MKLWYFRHRRRGNFHDCDEEDHSQHVLRSYIHAKPTWQNGTNHFNWDLHSHDNESKRRRVKASSKWDASRSSSLLLVPSSRVCSVFFESAYISSCLIWVSIAVDFTVNLTAECSEFNGGNSAKLNGRIQSWHIFNLGCLTTRCSFNL